MAGQPDRNHRPQYGWSPATLLDEFVLGESGGALPDVTDAVERPHGMLRGAVVVTVQGGASAGSGQFGVQLQGSHTGGSDDAEWVTIGSSNLEELFDAGDSDTVQRVLGLTAGRNAGQGFIGEGQTTFGRWRFLRVASFVSSGTPTFEMTVTVTGISDDSNFQLDSADLVRTSGDTSEPEGDPIMRPNGVRYLVGQLTISEMILIPDPSDGFNFLLQGAVNQSAVDADNWSTIDILGPFTTTGTGFFANGQTRDIDLGAFQFIRVIGEKDDEGTPSDDTSSYTATFYLGSEDCDWRTGEIGVNQLNDAVRQTFVSVVGGPVTGVLPTRTFTIQLTDMDMIPLRAVRTVGLLISNSLFGGYDDLVGGASFTAISGGATFKYGSGGNVCVVETNTVGQATLTVATGGANPAYVYAWTGHVPRNPSEAFFGPGQVVLSSERIDLING